MIPTNVLQRTFRLRYGDNMGTGFTIDVDNRQYLITAHHVMPSVKANDSLLVHHANQWKHLDITLVGHGGPDFDVTVLALPVQLGPLHPLIPSSGGMALGQDVYFLGYPYGLSTYVGP